MRRTAAKIAVAWAALSSAIPAVGGYSNTAPHQAFRARWSSDFTSVGIVTQVSGGAFTIKNDRDGSVRELNMGDGLLKGQQLWVESGGLVRFSTPKENSVTISGPARVTLGLDDLQIINGVVRFKAAAGKTLAFQHVVMAGAIRGEAAIWASRGHVQFLAFSGENKVWHPALASAKVAVSPGYFTETSTKFTFLSPRVPKRVSEESYNSLVARFENDREANLREDVAELAPVHSQDAHGRSIASTSNVAHRDAFVGSRSTHEISEEKNEAILSHLKARYSGLDVEEVGRPPLTVDPFARLARQKSAKGSESRSPAGRAVAGRIEIKKTKRSMEQEHREFIKKLEQSF